MNNAGGRASALPSRRVTAIRLRGPFRRFEQIAALAGPGWGPLSVEQVIESIDQGWSYYTEDDGQRAYLKVESNGRSARYLRSRPDCTRTSNLLNLPRMRS